MGGDVSGQGQASVSTLNIGDVTRPGLGSLPGLRWDCPFQPAGDGWDGPEMKN